MLTFLSIIRVKIGASKKGFIEKDLVWTSCEFTTAHGAALHSPVVFTYARPGPRSSCAWQLVASRLSSLCGLPRCNPKSSPVAPPFPSSEAAQVSSKRPCMTRVEGLACFPEEEQPSARLYARVGSRPVLFQIRQANIVNAEAEYNAFKLSYLKDALEGDLIWPPAPYEWSADGEHDTEMRCWVPPVVHLYPV